MPLRYRKGKTTGSITHDIVGETIDTMATTNKPTYIREVELHYKKRRVSDEGCYNFAENSLMQRLQGKAEDT